jgi:hypothetical protein
MPNPDFMRMFVLEEHDFWKQFRDPIQGMVKLFDLPTTQKVSLGSFQR